MASNSSVDGTRADSTKRDRFKVLYALSTLISRWIEESNTSFFALWSAAADATARGLLFFHHPSRQNIKLDNEVPSPASTSETGALPPRNGLRGRRWPLSCFPGRCAECSGWTWTPFSSCSTPCTRWISREAPPQRSRRQRRKLPPAPRPCPRSPQWATALARGKRAARGRGKEKDAGGGNHIVRAFSCGFCPW